MEVLDSKIEDKWFIRTLTSSPEAGWIPSIVLEQVGEEEMDGRMTITSGEGGKRERGESERERERGGRERERERERGGGRGKIMVVSR